MRSRGVGVIALALVSGCAQGTFVSLSIDQRVTSPTTARIGFALMLDGKSATGSLASPGSKAIAFPTTATLQIGSGSGALAVVATAYDANGDAIDEASATVDVVPGKTVPLALALGGGSGGGDMALPTDGGMPGVPSAPTNVVASSGNAQATVVWSAPASSGSSPITSYTVTSSPGGIKVTTPDGNTTMATIAGLTNGTTYTFAVTATNAVGSGPAALSNGVTPTAMPMVPSAPTNVMAVANVDHGATLSWTASDNHGSALVGYTISATQLTGTLGTAGPTATSATVTGLTPGNNYTFTITAANGVGTSSASFPSNTITAATVPGAPTAVTGSANFPNGVTVHWTAPASDGFSAITSYTVTAIGGPSVMSATSPAQVSGLTPGSSYSFTVTATNIIGAGPASSPSKSVMVLPQLAAPTGVSICNRNLGTVSVTFNSVSGASSYDVFFNSTTPATAGSKVNFPSSPAMLTLPTGNSYVAVAAVNGAGDGVASADQLVYNDGSVHDTLFVYVDDSPTFIDIFDCWSTLPTGTSAPTRSLSNTPGQFGDAELAVDTTNAVIFAGDNNTKAVSIWTNANTVNGTTAANYTMTTTGSNGAIAVDPVNHKLYVGADTQGHIDRFAYTSAAALNGATLPEASLTFGTNTSGFAAQLYVNPANGDLWVTSSAGSGWLFSAAYGLTSGTAANKKITLSSSTAGQGITYLSTGGGTLYLGGGGGIYWLTGVDSLATGTYTASGSLTGTPSYSLGSGPAWLISDAASGGTYTIDAWAPGSVSGSPAKSVSGMHTATTYYSGGAIVYAP
jgi:hypothetical protein